MDAKREMLPKKLVVHKMIKGIIKVETGLHIGGSSETIEIGGMDNPIIINPVTKEPYIPGSSLKGKMRALLEWKMGKIEESGNPYGFHEDDDDNHPISRIFGTSSDDAKLGPSRLIVRDAFVADEYKKRMKSANKNWTWIDMIEEKTENAINRITARANPRPIQRVVTGTEFQFEIIYRIFDFGDNGKVDRDFFKHVLEGLNLIEMDALGGSGSRGSGKVTFWISIDNEQKPLHEITPENLPDIELM